MEPHAEPRVLYRRIVPQTSRQVLLRRFNPKNRRKQDNPDLVQVSGQVLQVLELHELKIQRPHQFLPAHAHLAQYPGIQDEERDAAQQGPQILEPHLRGTAEEEGVLTAQGTAG